MQPVAQFLAAFPANLLFPIAVSAIVVLELDPDIWLSPLMILGTQWYILFNVDCRRCGDPRTNCATLRTNLQVARLAVVAHGRVAGRVPVLCDGRNHRVRRLVEREHRRGGREHGAISAWRRYGLGAYIARRNRRRAISIASCSALQ